MSLIDLLGNRVALGNLNSFCVAPQLLETIEFALIRLEDMNNDLGEVQEDPSPFGFALSADGLHAHLGEQGLLDFLGDHFDLSIIAASADDEVVGDHELLGNAHHYDIFCLLFACSLCSEYGYLSCVQL